MYGIARERARDDAEDAMEAESRAIERRATAFCWMMSTSATRGGTTTATAKTKTTKRIEARESEDGDDRIDGGGER